MNLQNLVTHRRRHVGESLHRLAVGAVNIAAARYLIFFCRNLSALRSSASAPAAAPPEIARSPEDTGEVVRIVCIDKYVRESEVQEITSALGFEILVCHAFIISAGPRGSSCGPGPI